MSGDVFELRSGAAIASIARHGGELLRWAVDGRDLLWSVDARFWDRTSPLLFPVVGWCRDAQIRIAGRSFPMPVHGFAMAQDFEVTRCEEAAITMQLRDDDVTRAHYPFAFALEVTYTLTETSIEIELRVENRDVEPMPFACGLHPGFHWPDGPERAGHAIEFPAQEAREIPVIAPGGLFSPERRSVDFDGRRLALSDELFAREALCFLNAQSHAVALTSGDGGRLQASFENFPHIALWSRPGAPFVCIEAWTGHGDPVGFIGNLAEKPSMIVLPHGAESHHSAHFEWAAPPRAA